MRWLKWMSYTFLCLVGLLVLMVIIGAFLPEQHSVSATVSLPASQDRVWHLMTDLETQPRWRTGLKSVAHLPEENGHPCWTEVQKHMRMPLCADLSVAPSTRIIRIADPSLPFGGNWNYQLQATGKNASRLTITENGTVGPALWRFLDRFLIHEDASIKQYEADLLREVTKSEIRN